MKPRQQFRSGTDWLKSDSDEPDDFASTAQGAPDPKQRAKEITKPLLQAIREALAKIELPKQGGQSSEHNNEQK